MPLQRFLVAVLWPLGRPVTLRKQTFLEELEGEFSHCLFSFLITALSPAVR